MKKNSKGFTLIELLVVIAIIGLLASVILVAVYNARAKSRDAKRVGDMTRMVTAFELYSATFRGYPVASPAGSPSGMSPNYIASLPTAPNPADGDCTVTNPLTGQPANTYYYIPSGTMTTINGVNVYPDYEYYFCLGNKTGDMLPGVRYLTPKGIK